MVVPRRYAPYIFAALQVSITTGVATLIATINNATVPAVVVPSWLYSWVGSLAIMLPFVLVCAPLLQRLVLRMTFEG